ncbi:Rrf2 family transcriptional regulator [Sphingopyxis witflariensis]|uniref:Rrf2 family transcriptional regulator n=1 Tax=Sphingopyxis witflariensis TaxID=173675 RepID=A0A246JDI4_9SPHN|nr:Rrf2 family transcriptional regulator [Sphingopyxis witflariensis]OWQ90557.1 Rrf2 family transcriptional regulator [Sphingopyxis witflariensis]
MKLTLFTDYSMRALLHLGAHPDRLCSIAEVAGAFGISQNHLMKVVNQLARQGYVETVRGRLGGIRLGRPPEEINIGALVRDTEEGFDLADCGSCVIAPACGLTGVLGQALAAFMTVLDGYTLADLLVQRGELRQLLTGEFNREPLQPGERL